MRRVLLRLVPLLILVVVDQVTKEAAASYLKGAAAVSVVPRFFNLIYVENRGCAWGLFQHQVWPLAIFGLLALGFLIWKRRSIFLASSRLAAWAEPILYAGVIGNLLDRICRGYVIDFFDFHWQNISHFPCFNVADVCITVAAGLLVLDSFFTRRHQTAFRHRGE